MTIWPTIWFHTSALALCFDNELNEAAKQEGLSIFSDAA